MPGTIEVRAEWPGQVVEIHVAVGDAVSEGQVVLTLESMKMLTDVESPVAGTISAVHVAEHAAVEANDLLLGITTA